MREPVFVYKMLLAGDNRQVTLRQVTTRPRDEQQLSLQKGSQASP